MPATREGADIVIIGNGIAGLTAAIEARRQDADKRIVIMTDQLHSTINTPALKQFAVNKLKREQLLAYPSGTTQSLHIDIINAHVEEIHAESKYLVLNRNLAFGYGKLLVATGSQPNGLPEEIPGRTFDGVLVLHRLKDYQDLRRRLPDVRDAVVLGGGTHANEMVMTLLHWGIRVHWLIRGENFLPGTLDSTASELVLSKVRRAGAIIHTETTITAVVGRLATVGGVITDTGRMISCQLVLSCTGTYPAQGLAKQCTAPMMFKDGILVDGRLRTSVPDIYAAGDVAALPNPQTGHYETRGQWHSAVMQGKLAGAMMVGHTEMASEVFGVPWHATQLGKLSMLTVGDPLGSGKYEQMAVYTDTSRGGYRRLAVNEGRLVGYLSVGTTQPDGLSIKRLIDEGFPIRDLLKPLLKGKFDAHRYLTLAKTRTVATRPIPILENLKAFQWPDTMGEMQAIRWLEAEKQSGTLQWPGREPSWLLSSRPVIPANAFPLEMHIEQPLSAGASYQTEQLYLSAQNNHTSSAITSQFMQPDSVDTRHNKQKDFATMPYGQPEQDRTTDLLRVVPRSYAQPEQYRATEPLPDGQTRVTESLPGGQLPFSAVSDKPRYLPTGPSNHHGTPQNLTIDPLVTVEESQ
jgi:NADPH-dependent 2,4-dienoyl-CoA reductase/sulfur reductase-like enzyme